ncbi:transcription initiation factor TFIID subunit 4 isoform X3 [Bactrocera neohumeralis]|uniref:transcription initiation factor TFIID subunit 4 isoform X3 n=1 Tax=Bactrocera tryoni TaxID=59916 RepID=UPI001A98F98C|nr:transcription initiation factor TFIID subunit 4 isoform X3 [Bactrocera tryoni]XP_050333383.1 transcription initiation factor TFIID subunit 4 isoform X3 [Bactrocera neohumeralis]
MAASSAKFFVHQNQNKANSSRIESVITGDYQKNTVSGVLPTPGIGNVNSKDDFALTNNEYTTKENEYGDKIHYKSGCDRRSATTVSAFGGEGNEAFVDIEEVISTKTVIVNTKSGSGSTGDINHNKSSDRFSQFESDNVTTLPEEINNNFRGSAPTHTLYITPKTFASEGNAGINAKFAYQLQTQNIQHNNTQALQKEASSLHSVAKPLNQHNHQWADKPPTNVSTKILNIRAPASSLASTSLSSATSSYTNFAMNSSQSTQAPGNRITFTSQTLPNGTINIGGAAGHPPGSTIISTSQLPNTTTIKTITSSGAGGQHHTLPQQVQVQHHQGNQQPLLNSMIPANVVVGMRPPNAQQQQKNVPGNTLGRVVIGGPHMVGARPQNPAITLSTLAPGQTPALILKTENGYQLLRVGTATSGPVTPTIGGSGGTNSNPAQIRLQTVPAASMAVSSSASNNIVVNSVASSTAGPHHTYTSQANITLQQPHHQTALQHQQQQQTHLQSQHQQLHQQTQHLLPQPQITQIQTIPAQHSASATASTGSAANTTTMSNNHSAVSTASAGTTTGTANVTTTQSAAQGNTKEKCRKFLANLIDLATREPKPVEKNVRNLIQELVNANVEPEEFCDRLERLLNASPQPCLIGFLKKSLPLLRQALFTRELVIEGIKPPPQHVAGLTTLQQFPKIQAQIRPITQSQTTTIGQTQVRMISPAGPGGPRPIGHTTITKQQGGIRIQGPTNGPRLVNAQIRGPIPASIQQANAQLPSAPTQASIVHIRAPTVTQISRPTTVQIRTAKGKNAPPGITHVKVGQTQIKAIASPVPSLVATNQPPSLTAISNSLPPSSTPSLSAVSTILSTINSVATYSNASSGTSLPTPSLPTVQLPPSLMHHSSSHLSSHAAIAGIGESIRILDPKLENVIKQEKIIPVTPPANKTTAKSGAASASKASSKKKKEQLDKEKEEKANASGAAVTAAMSSFYQQPSISMSSSVYGDDDINDVAAMGGVNLAEESQRILGSTENIGTQIRSCKDEVFLHLPALQARIRAMVLERGLEEPSQDVAVLISHACQERLKNVVEKLAVIAEHRIDVIKLDPRYEVTKDVRGQIKFLEELDKAEQKRHEELEREMLLRAAKSRSKIEDPEQAKMKARAKEMQRAEMEELRQRDANMTALQAIGPRKKIKLDGDATGAGANSNASGALGGSSVPSVPLRPRIKRVNLRDMLFFMEQERETSRSQMLYKAYLK